MKSIDQSWAEIIKIEATHATPRNHPFTREAIPLYLLSLSLSLYSTWTSIRNERDHRKRTNVLSRLLSRSNQSKSKAERSSSSIVVVVVVVAASNARSSWVRASSRSLRSIDFKRTIFIRRRIWHFYTILLHTESSTAVLASRITWTSLIISRSRSVLNKKQNQSLLLLLLSLLGLSDAARRRLTILDLRLRACFRTGGEIRNFLLLLAWWRLCFFWLHWIKRALSTKTETKRNAKNNHKSYY